MALCLLAGAFLLSLQRDWREKDAAAHEAAGVPGVLGDAARERFGPAELLGRLEGTQPHNEWASRCPREMPRGPACMSVTPSLSCRCNIREMPSKVPVKCSIAGCHRRVKMILAEREELRRVGRENNATAGVVCPTDVKAAFNSGFDDIDIDVPLGEFLVEASKGTPRWRVMLTPLPRVAGEPDSQSTPRRGDRVI